MAPTARSSPTVSTSTKAKAFSCVPRRVRSRMSAIAAPVWLQPTTIATATLIFLSAAGLSRDGTRYHPQAGCFGMTPRAAS